VSCRAFLADNANPVKDKRQTIWITSAAGGVGQIIGQLAKQMGMRVIGSVGSDEKIDFIVNELGFDAAFNYRNESPSKALQRIAPEGLDVTYDNVGADHLQAAIDHTNWHGKVIICGSVS
jgi:NADPH-dependent curcumin reductase CurA